MKRSLLLLVAILSCAACSKKHEPAPTQVSTLAGNGTAGNANGPALQSSFNFPYGLTIDAAGNIYVADTQNNMIRKITPDGTVSTFAGSGIAGATDGTGTAASLNYPAGLAIDGTGNIYVGEIGSHIIRKISPAGVVTTFAGSGANALVDGKGKAASFIGPNQLAFDLAGNLFVGDEFALRKITPDGTVSTIAGSASSGYADGTGSAAMFGAIGGVVADAQDIIYVSDPINNIIRKVTPAGLVTTYAGNGIQAGPISGTLSAVSFVGANGLTMDGSGNIYVSDAAYNVIRKINTATGQVTVPVGSTGLGHANGNYKDATFFQNEDVILDHQGNLIIADSRNNLIRKAAAGF